MQIIFSTPDEREIIRRLCDDLAAKHSSLYKQAHLLLKGAMEAKKKRRKTYGSNAGDPSFLVTS